MCQKPYPKNHQLSYLKSMNTTAPSNALITGAGRGLGLSLTENLLKKGWIVFAGFNPSDPSELESLAEQYPSELHCVPIDIGATESVEDALDYITSKTGVLDLIINNAAILGKHWDSRITESQDYEELLQILNINSLGPIRVVEKCLPLMSSSPLKRICMVSSEAGSIERSQRDSWFGYCMSKSALNMATKNMFNQLRPMGYSMRVYHPGWIQTYMAGEKDIKAPLTSPKAAANAIKYFIEDIPDENQLSLVDFEGKLWPW